MAGASYRAFLCAALLLGGAASVACRQDMHDNPRYDPLEESAFFADGRSERQPIANTVPRGFLREDPHLYEGKINGQLADTFPVPVGAQMMLRGQERFNVFCAPCHGRTGKGDGMVVRRGFRAPSSLHDERLRKAPVGYFFDVMTHGFGAMQDYAAQVAVDDRWAIAAYIRALQLSQNATINDVPAARRGELDKSSGGAGLSGPPVEPDRLRQGYGGPPKLHAKAEGFAPPKKTNQ